MPKQNAHIAHFHVGEFSDAGLARVDLEITPLAAETQENLFPHAIGYGQARPGLKYLGSTSGNNRARLIPFVRSIDDVALLELTSGALRVWVDDELITRPEVTSSVTNGDFSSATGWTTSASSGALSTITGGTLVMSALARGSEAYCERVVTTSSPGIQHALRIVVTRGPVIFRCGSSSGGQDYISETTLDTGYHSIAFTPSTSFYVRFITRNPRQCVVDSITVESAGVMSVPAPWTTDQLRSFRYDQSADVIFLANRNLQQLKIERRSPKSWSVVYYYADDGPFQGTPVEGASMTPSATFGDITITSDKPVFESTMVGSLIRLYHDRLDASWTLAGDDTYTDVFAIRGVKGEKFNDRQFSYQISGSWSGTLRVQRSLTGEDGDFLDYNKDDGTSSTTITGNTSVTHAGEAEDNNVISYTRIGFIAGAYTSGSATVSVQYEGASGYGVGRITGYNSATSVDVEVLENFNATSGTKSWEIGSWSAYNGWPSAVSLYDGRLWWGGLDNVWGSASDAYYSFDDLETTDSSTIQRQIATGGQVSRIAWFLPLQRMIIGTAGSEVSMRASDVDGFLTPGGVTLKDASTFGSADVQPTRLDSRGMFTHRSGLRVIAVGYSFEDNDYRSADLCELNENICGDGVVEMAIQREPETYVWCVREDGQCAILIYDIEDKENRIQGWSRFITDGIVESIAVLPEDSEDAVYMEIDRSYNSEVANGAQVLATDDSGNPLSTYISCDFTDFSLSIADANNAANAVESSHSSSTDRLDEWGRRLGPDKVFDTAAYWASGYAQPVQTRHQNNRFHYNYHNFISSSDGLSGSWTNTNGNITRSYNAAAGPNGEVTATKITPNTSTTDHYVRCTVSVGGDGGGAGGTFRPFGDTVQYACSAWFKADGYSKIQVSLSTNLNAITTGFWNTGSSGKEWILHEVDLTDGSVTTDIYHVGGGALKYVWDLGVSVESSGSGWYRTVAKWSNYAVYGYFIIRVLNDNGETSFAGDGTSGILVWGTQVNYLGVPDDSYVYNPGYTQFAALLPYEYEYSATGDGACLGVVVRPETSLESAAAYVTRSACSAYIDISTLVDDVQEATFIARCVDATWASGIISPDGTYTTGRWTNTGAAGSGTADDFAGSSHGPVPGSGYVSYSIFVRAESFPYISCVYIRDTLDLSMNFWSVTFNVSEGTISQDFYQEGAGTGWNSSTQGFLNRNAGVEQYADGWFRIWTICENTEAGNNDVVQQWVLTNFSSPASTDLPYYQYGAATFTSDVWLYPTGQGLLVWGLNQHNQDSGQFYAPRYIDRWGTRAINVLDTTNIQSDKFNINLEDHVTVSDSCLALFEQCDVIDYLNQDQFDNTGGSYGGENTQGFAMIYGYDSNLIRYMNGINSSDNYQFLHTYGFGAGENAKVDSSTSVTLNQTVNVAFTAGLGTMTFALDNANAGSVSQANYDLPLELTHEAYDLNLSLMDPQGSVGASRYIKKLLVTFDCPDVNTLLNWGGDQAVVIGDRTIEKLSKHSAAVGGVANEMCDSWVYAAGPVSSITAAHIAGKSGLIAWVTQSGTQYALSGLSSDADGVIALGDTYTEVYVGLPYTAKYKSSKLVYGAPNGGVALMQPKRVGELGLLLENTHRDAVSFGGDFDTMRKMSLISGGKPVAANTIYTVHDQIAFSFPGYWDTDSRVCLKVEAPYPATFLGLVISVEEHERGIKPRRR